MIIKSITLTCFQELLCSAVQCVAVYGAALSCFGQLGKRSLLRAVLLPALQGGTLPLTTAVGYGAGAELKQRTFNHQEALRKSFTHGLVPLGLRLQSRQYPERLQGAFACVVTCKSF